MGFEIVTAVADAQRAFDDPGTHRCEKPKVSATILTGKLVSRLPIPCSRDNRNNCMLQSKIGNGCG